MKKNKVDKNLDAPNASWTFKGNVSKSFSDHVEKSVPFYKEGHELYVTYQIILSMMIQ